MHQINSNGMGFELKYFISCGKLTDKENKTSENFCSKLPSIDDNWNM